MDRDITKQNGDTAAAQPWQYGAVTKKRRDVCPKLIEFS